MRVLKNINEVDFSKGDGLVPVIIQDQVSNKVLMLGYMNAEALEKTLSEGKVTFFSRSKNRLWTKGEASNNYIFVKIFYRICRVILYYFPINLINCNIH